MRRIRSRRLRIIWNITKIAILLVVAGSLGVLTATFYGISKMLPSGQEIDVYTPSEATLIYSSDGALLARVYEENREPVPITEMPKQLQDATVAIEDSRFYTHSGVDLKGVLRALVENVRGGRVKQGGSTLTQQLARNIYLTHRRTMSRKVQEMMLAREIERRLSKQEILQLYLNQVYYGSGAYGVKAAARTYFGKQPKDLTLSESALLAGLPRRPSGWSPYENEKAAINRRDVVLNRMAELGYITEEEARTAKAEELHLVGQQIGRSRRKKAPHFVDYVVNQLVEKWGPDEVYRGGLRVYTSLNLQVQESAERAIRRQVMATRERGKRVGQGAMVAIDPHNGHIKAMVGSLDYYDPNLRHGGQFNRTIQGRGRQPGSAFKAFVYTAAIDNGYSPDDILQDKPISFPDGDKTWAPKNLDGKFRGPVTIKYAVEQSLNIPAIRMLHTLGVDKVIAYAQRMGIKSPLGRDLSLAIGTSEVTPLELASAYGTFPAGGLHAEPLAIVKVIGRNDRVLEDNRPKVTRAIPRETAETMAEIFRGVVQRGTARRAAVIKDAGGKTGTTQDLRDAWFVGFTPDLVAAVWVGNDDYTPMGSAVYGGSVCAPAWVEMMQTAVPIMAKAKRDAVEEKVSHTKHEPRPKTTDAQRQEIREDIENSTVFRVICLESGLIAVNDCPRRRKVGFPRGSEPAQTCVIHGTYGETPTTEPTSHEGVGETVGASDAADGGAATGRNAPAPGKATAPRSDTQLEEVTICVQSKRRAGEYCPEVELKKMPPSQVPSSCTAHVPTAGDNASQQ